eukprot:g10411.t1
MKHCRPFPRNNVNNKYVPGVQAIRMGYQSFLKKNGFGKGSEQLPLYLMQMIKDRHCTDPPTLTIEGVRRPTVMADDIDYDMVDDVDLSDTQHLTKHKNNLIGALKMTAFEKEGLLQFFQDIDENPARARLCIKYTAGTGRGSGEQRLEHILSFLKGASQRITTSSRNLLKLCNSVAKEGAAKKKDADGADSDDGDRAVWDPALALEEEKASLFDNARLLQGDCEVGEALAMQEDQLKAARSEKDWRRRVREQAFPVDPLDGVLYFDCDPDLQLHEDYVAPLCDNEDEQEQPGDGAKSGEENSKCAAVPASFRENSGPRASSFALPCGGESMESSFCSAEPDPEARLDPPQPALSFDIATLVSDDRPALD